MTELMIDLDDEVIAEIYEGYEFIGFYHGGRHYGGISFADVLALHKLVKDYIEEKGDEPVKIET